MRYSKMYAHGRLLALFAQSVLLACTVGVVLLSLVFRIPGEQAGSALQRAALFGLQALPNALILAGLCRKARWANWFGLGAALVALYMLLPLIRLGTSGWMLAYTVLWGLTVVGLVLEHVATSRPQAPVGRRIVGAGLYFSLGLGLALLPIGLTILSLVTALRERGGTAPTTDVVSRRAWGQRVFGPYLTHIDQWVAESEAIRRDVGVVQSVSPLGAPNRFHPGFTDGGYAEMNLEVIGSKGKGVLFLPYVDIWGTGQLQSIGSDARWTFAGQTHLMATSGRTYLDEHQLGEVYFQLLELAERGAADEFVTRWRELETALTEAGLEAPFGHLRPEQLIGGLHARYREPILACYGDALARLDRNQEAVEAYRQAASSAIKRAKVILDEQRQDRRQLPLVASALSQANTALNRANELIAGDRKTLNLARDRALLQYLHATDGRTAPVYSANNQYDQKWAESCLGIFYREAVEYAKTSPYLQRTLGGVSSIRIDPQANSDLFVNENNAYAATICLRVEGRQGHGTLRVRIRENDQRCPPIDLFNTAVRFPDYPLTIRSPYWEPEGGAEVKLSAKNGEPLKRAVSQ